KAQHVSPALSIYVSVWLPRFDAGWCPQLSSWCRSLLKAFVVPRVERPSFRGLLRCMVPVDQQLGCLRIDDDLACGLLECLVGLHDTQRLLSERLFQRLEPA